MLAETILDHAHLASDFEWSPVRMTRRIGHSRLCAVVPVGLGA